MSLYITSLNSGSNGNCYYIGNGAEAVLIDAGISCRETEKRMNRLGLSMESVKAVFVSHEHIDHITGIPGISKKYQLPVYITPSTLAAANIPIEAHLIQHFTATQPVKIGALNITAFTKFHDAADPHSFIVSGNHVTVGVFTDIGHACPQVISYIQKCHAVFLEANYCDEMLGKGRYPAFLKQRISDNNGHLSNAQALDLFLNHRNNQLHHLILAHLSKNNNSPALVEKLFSEKAGHTAVTVASRHKETPVFFVGEKKGIVTFKKGNTKPQTQLSLF